MERATWRILWLSSAMVLTMVVMWWMFYDKDREYRGPDQPAAAPPVRLAHSAEIPAARREHGTLEWFFARLRDRDLHRIRVNITRGDPVDRRLVRSDHYLAQVERWPEAESFNHAVRSYADQLTARHSAGEEDSFRLFYCRPFVMVVAKDDPDKPFVEAAEEVLEDLREVLPGQEVDPDPDFRMIHTRQE